MSLNLFHLLSSPSKYSLTLQCPISLETSLEEFHHGYRVRLQPCVSLETVAGELLAGILPVTQHLFCWFGEAAALKPQMIKHQLCDRYKPRYSFSLKHCFKSLFAFFCIICKMLLWGRRDCKQQQ